MRDDNLIADLRAAADLLERVNRLYGFPLGYAGWSPLELRNEARALEIADARIRAALEGE